MMMTNYNDGEWHQWTGGECPVHPESVVEVAWSVIAPASACKENKGKSWNWYSEQLVAFRVVKEHKEPREYTIDPKKFTIWYSTDDDLVHVRKVTE